MADKKPKNNKTDQKIQELETAYAEVQNKLQETQESLLRALADLQNIQRRESENKMYWSRDAVCNFLEKLLPRLIELEKGKQHTTDKDIQKTIDNLFQSLEKTGFEKIAPQKETPIDPEKHDVLLTAPGKAGCIVDMLEPGWMFQSKVITPAKVSAAQT